jgi:hypothetical protein
VFLSVKISKKKKHTKINRFESKIEVLLDKVLNTIFENRAARNSVAPNTITSRYILY